MGRTLRGYLRLAFLLLALVPARAFAAEQTFAVGGDFYSGDPTKNLTPLLGFHLGYGAAFREKKMFNLTSRFEIGMFFLGDHFGSTAVTYNGIKGTWDGGLRINFGRDQIIPFVELGPSLGIFDVFMFAAPSGSSKNQGSVKYGYFVSLGVDRYKGKGRGTGGWGMDVKYFNYQPSISMLEFPAGTLNITGVEMSFRFHLPTGH